MTKSTDSDPVAAGTNLTNTITVVNNGPNVVLDVVLNLPTEVSFVSADPPCVHDAGEVTCELGDFTVSAPTEVEIVVSVPHNLVYNSEPVTITNTATAT